MSWPAGCRRTQPRFPLESARGAHVEFEFPKPGSGWSDMPLRDLSQSGLSFVLTHELPGLTVGDCIAQVQIHVDGRLIRGDLLVMHLNPGADAGAVCGALFYPVEDTDVLALRDLVRSLELAALTPAGAY
jgi:hypothetical protein